MEIEKQYVHEVYSRLASHCAEKESKKKLRIWPNVKKFIDELPPGSVVIDVGCGQMKYEIYDGFLLGSDICPEVLLQAHKCPLSDVHLADALHLPYRDESVDAALFISVVHHFSSLERRR
uniref:Methyltransferase type 11 domain-containing protein n=1 Tax=Parascaris univalens TaxID=6257 RepID=A0A915ATK4_PARUN